MGIFDLFSKKEKAKEANQQKNEIAQKGAIDIMNKKMIFEENEIKSELKKYIESFNNQCPDKKIDLDNLFINDCINKPGAIGCYYKNSEWYIYHVDDKFNLLVNGPFSKDAIITAIATMLFIPSHIVKYSFTDAEYDLYLQGERPADSFDKKHLFSEKVSF